MPKHATARIEDTELRMDSPPSAEEMERRRETRIAPSLTHESPYHPGGERLLARIPGGSGEGSAEIPLSDASSSFLDSNILGRIVQPTVEENRPVVATITRLFEDVRFRIYLPEIVDYELRRKFLHLAHRPHQARKWAQEGLKVLDQFALTNYIPITTETMQLAAKLWAQTRISGLSRGPEDRLGRRRHPRRSSSASWRPDPYD